MRFLLGGLVVLFMLALAVGALTGRVRARNCCSPPPRSEPGGQPAGSDPPAA